MLEWKVIGSDYSRTSEIIFINNIPEQNLTVFLKPEMNFMLFDFQSNLLREAAVQSR